MVVATLASQVRTACSSLRLRPASAVRSTARTRSVAAQGLAAALGEADEDDPLILGSALEQAGALEAEDSVASSAS